MVLKTKPVNEPVWHLVPGFYQFLISSSWLWVVLLDRISGWFPIELVGLAGPARILKP